LFDSEEIPITQAKLHAGQVGLMATLMKNKSYQLVFQFEESIIDESSSSSLINSCPEFKMKLAIDPINKIQSKNVNSNRCCGFIFKIHFE
jgi:hypothetical protein